jgi:IMP dehydrogenase
MKTQKTQRTKRGDRIVAEIGLTFDDLLLLPGRASVPREQVDLTTVLHPRIRLTLPVIASPMDTVTEEVMAIALAAHGGFGVIHRNLQVAVQAGMVKAVKNAAVPDGASKDAKGRLLVGAAVGAGGDLEERVAALVKAGADLLVVDSGHGHSDFILDALRWIRAHYGKEVALMAGNVATFEGARDTIAAGADILRVGMGPGSICTTRVVTGMGVPQMTALFAAARAVQGTKATFIADGGVRQMGDMAKALGTGASAVMLGSMLGGYSEAPGKVVELQGKQWKQYRGMGSIGAMQKGGAERYGQKAATPRENLIAEGVEGLIPYKGHVEGFLTQAAGSLRSAFYYVGAGNLPQFHERARFIRITPASMAESHPHTVRVTDAGESYL